MALALSACAALAPEDAGSRSASRASQTSTPAQILDPIAAVNETALQAAPDLPKEMTSLFPGTGKFIDTGAAQKQAPLVQTAGDVTLNFERADIREVVKVIFDTLKENYVIDPQVQGEVTVQTSRPLPKALLLPTLETLLRMNNAALVSTDGVYKVVPVGAAVAGNLLPRLEGAQRGPGYGLRIVPLRYISALEMEKILKPLLPEGAIVRVDPARNMLVLAGTAQELANVDETVDIFDVNWLKGMSVGIYRLRNVDSATITDELERIFGAESKLPLAGMFRFVPISQLNAVLVITPQPEYLREAGKWVQRLDDIGGERLYVYDVQNGKADYLASLLNGIFGGGGGRSGRKTPAAEVAPRLTPSTLSAPAQSDQTSEAQPSAPARQSQSASTTELGVGAEQVRIVADVENNSLLIWANSQTYEKILDAVQRLDVRPRQVLIEATIAEVTLSGNLQYGLQWFFKNNDAIQGLQGTGSLDLRTNVPLTTPLGEANVLGNGFTYALSDGAGFIRALLRVLASDSKVNVLSSPQILVIDNQEAEIRVGDQQPVRTSTTVTDGGNRTESIEFKDTGVILNVRPQVNAGGLVTMDINQEVIDVGQTIDAATGQRAFLQRKVNSRVAVQSGQSIVLGGLIRDRRSDDNSGIPVLYKLPLVGPLFGSVEKNTARTELLVLITPRVIESNQEAQRITHDLRQRMESLIPLTDLGW